MTTFKKLSPDQEMQSTGLLTLDMEKISTSSLSHKNAKD